MIPSRIAAALCAAAVVTGTAVPAVASAQNYSNQSQNIVDVVISASGASGFDRHGGDYDLLREALVATGLAEAVATSEDITVFAPNDFAFIRLARDLGYDGYDETGSFGYLAELTGFVSAEEPGLLADVLLYHVAPGASTVWELNRRNPVATLLEGATVEVRGSRVIDADTNDRDAYIRYPRNFSASNGIIQTVSRVLRPIDLEAPAPELPATVVDVVLEVSGAEGFDSNGGDYDLLRDALVATGLVTAVAEATDITVFAPTDAAFLKLATDLGYTGSDEAGAFGFLAEATGFVSADEPGILADVLLYHVAPGAQNQQQLNAAGPIATLLADATVEVDRGHVIDADPNDENAEIVRPADIQTGNGIIQTVSRVLRPIDLPPVTPPQPNIVEAVIERSGAEGFDRHYFDFDLLREALIATGLADAVATTDDITVFAPYDYSFVLLARDLGFRGVDEAGAFAFLAEATGYVSADEPGLLDDVLLYHVLPGSQSLRELGRAGDLDTLLADATVNVRGRRVRDADRNDFDPFVYERDLQASNGTIHTIIGVLRPLDL